MYYDFVSQGLYVLLESSTSDYYKVLKNISLWQKLKVNVSVNTNFYCCINWICFLHYGISDYGNKTYMRLDLLDIKSLRGFVLPCKISLGGPDFQKRLEPVYFLWLFI